ncbi:MAG: virulence factor [Actinomycetota bacterium]
MTTIYWRDIPAQVTASGDGVTGKAMLEPRFQHAIDRAAAVADLTETDAYVAQWRRVQSPLDGDPTEAAEALAAKLSQDYPRDRLERLVAQGGAESTP